MSEIIIRIADQSGLTDLDRILLGKLDDKLIDQIEVDRKIGESGGLGNEPITVALVLKVTTLAIIPLLKLWLDEKKRQLDEARAKNDAAQKERLLKLYQRTVEVEIETGKVSPQTSKEIETMLAEMFGAR